MKEILIVCALIALFNPFSLIYAQCFLISKLLGGNKSVVEMVNLQPDKSALQVQQVIPPSKPLD